MTKRANPESPALHCWAHFGWMSKWHKDNRGVAGHIPHIARTREELVEQYGEETDHTMIVPVEIRIVPN